MLTKLDKYAQLLMIDIQEILYAYIFELCVKRNAVIVKHKEKTF